MQEFLYDNPVKLFCGEHQLPAVMEELRQYGNSVLLILGGESFVKNGNYQPLVDALEQAGITCYALRGNRTPSLRIVREGIDLCRKQNICCVLGIGGGVCMDIAKTIAFGVKQSRDIWEYLTYQAQPDTMEYLPVGTIPTIPSSGSDMDGATQITNDETAEQAGLSDVYPNFTWLNPAYIAKLPVKALIQGQMTSFVQVSIAYVGLERSGIAESMALALINSIRTNLRQLVQEPENASVRTDLMLSGAFNCSGLTHLGKTGDWSMYPLEGIMQNYYGVGYQQAITVLFPYWLKQCYGGQQVFKDYFAQVFGVDGTGKSDAQILTEGLRAIFDLYREFSLPTCFSDIQAREDDSDTLRNLIAHMGELPSMYTTFTTEKTECMMREAIFGIMD